MSPVYIGRAGEPSTPMRSLACLFCPIVLQTEEKASTPTRRHGEGVEKFGKISPPSLLARPKQMGRNPCIRASSSFRFGGQSRARVRNYIVKKKLALSLYFEKYAWKWTGSRRRICDLFFEEYFQISFEKWIRIFSWENTREMR